MPAPAKIVAGVNIAGLSPAQRTQAFQAAGLKGSDVLKAAGISLGSLTGKTVTTLPPTLKERPTLPPPTLPPPSAVVASVPPVIVKPEVSTPPRIEMPPPPIVDIAKASRPEVVKPILTDKPVSIFSDVAASVAKKIIPKVLIGGDKDDKAAVKAVVESGAADPVFQKFGKDLETGVKIAGGIGSLLLAGVGGGSGALQPDNLLKLKSGPTSEAQTGQPGGGIPPWVWPFMIGAALLFGKKLLR